MDFLKKFFNFRKHKKSPETATTSNTSDSVEERDDLVENFELKHLYHLNENNDVVKIPKQGLDDWEKPFQGKFYAGSRLARHSLDGFPIIEVSYSYKSQTVSPGCEVYYYLIVTDDSPEGRYIRYTGRSKYFYPEKYVRWDGKLVDYYKLDIIPSHQLVAGDYLKRFDKVHEYWKNLGINNDGYV